MPDSVQATEREARVAPVLGLFRAMPASGLSDVSDLAYSIGRMMRDKFAEEGQAGLNFVMEALVDGFHYGEVGLPVHTQGQ